MSQIIVPQPKDKISDHFTWKEALWLQKWNRMATAEELTQVILDNLVITFKYMDGIRDLFNAAVNVHVAYRPDAYNKLVGGATHSSHKDGKACDYDVLGFTCDAVRERLSTPTFSNADLKSISYIERKGLRMEKNPGSNWVHNDWADVPPGGNRYFNI